MSKYEEYKALVKASCDETRRMVEAGELTPEEGMFRDAFRKDEILDEMDNEDW